MHRGSDEEEEEERFSLRCIGITNVIGFQQIRSIVTDWRCRVLVFQLQLQPETQT